MAPIVWHQFGEQKTISASTISAISSGFIGSHRKEPSDSGFCGKDVPKNLEKGFPLMPHLRI
jgi:hypothetical protein